MYLGILIEKAYTSLLWFNLEYENLVKAAKNKRVSYKCYTIEELEAETDEVRHVVMLGTQPRWIGKALDVCHRKNINIIFYHNGNITEQNLSLRCNVVSSDIPFSVLQIISLFEAENKTSTALYAINPKSPPDAYLHQLYSKIIKPEDVYYHNSNLTECFENFYKNIDKYDSIVCANDYSAVALLNSLKKTAPDKIEKLFIVSYSGFVLSEHYSPSISTFGMNFSEFGKAAMFICEYFDDPHSNKSATLNIKVPCVFNSRQTTNFIPIPEISNDLTLQLFQKEGTAFVGDPIVSEITALETLLNNCADIDKKIIKLILDNQSTSTIADELFVSRSALRYRIDRLLNYSNCKDKTELIELLNKYDIKF